MLNILILLQSSCDKSFLLFLSSQDECARKIKCDAFLFPGTSECLTAECSGLQASILKSN